MKTQPMKRYRTPYYPIRLDILSDPGLLERHTPPAWKKTACMTSLAALFLGVNGCADKQIVCNDGPKAAPTIQEPAAVKETIPKPIVHNPPNNKAAIVAPIFEHGEGRGSVGCMMVTPPVFLSEEEALQIITEELSDASIDVSQKDVAINGVQIPPDFSKLGKDCPEFVPFHADIFDASKGIAIEYISKNDCFDLENSSIHGSVTDYRFKDVARFIDERIKTNAKGIYFASFYDPYPNFTEKECEDWMKEIHALVSGQREIEKIDRATEKERNDRFNNIWMQQQEILVNNKKLESKRLLRLQVKDFVEWLKGQGVI